MSCEDHMKRTVLNNDVTRLCSNVKFSKLMQNAFRMGGCEIMNRIWTLSQRRICAVYTEVGSKMLIKGLLSPNVNTAVGTRYLCLVFRLISITNVQTELHEHVSGDRSSVWAIVAGRISYKPILKHKMTLCGLYDNHNVFRSYLCTSA